jgi:tRNA-Thr(GGU) m(6)t(6)A37 methyltransferase TsaA
VADEDVASQRRKIVSDITILPEYASALTGIEEYSHLIVLFWMDRAPPKSSLLVHPRGNQSLPLTGTLASRGRSHPNPIGLAVVELLARQDVRLTVKQLDAFHGTPVIDIKPYDYYDVHTNIRVPEWLKQRALQHGAGDPLSGE